MVSLLLKRTIYSSVSLHIGDVKEKPDGFGVRNYDAELLPDPS